MPPYSPQNVKVGAGTLYAAPLGTVEPTLVTGAWPSGWQPLGYTEEGSTFSFTPTVAQVVVEEEFWPIRQVMTAYAGKLSFILAEQTRRNLILVLNGGFPTPNTATNQGQSITGGTIWAEAPTPGAEIRVMLGWDAQFEGASSGQDPFQRLIVRQCLQTGAIKQTHKKGNVISSYSAEFSFEKPLTGKSPFRILFEADLGT